MLACWVLATGEALRQARVRRPLTRALGRWAARLQEIVAAGRANSAFTAGEPPVVAAALIAAIQGYFVLAAVDRTAIPRGSAATAVKAMAAGLLQPATATVRRRSLKEA